MAGPPHSQCRAQAGELDPTVTAGSWHATTKSPMPQLRPGAAKYVIKKKKECLKNNPHLVPVFENCKKSEEDFPFYKKRKG